MTMKKRHPADQEIIDSFRCALHKYGLQSDKYPWPDPEMFESYLAHLLQQWKKTEPKKFLEMWTVYAKYVASHGLSNPDPLAFVAGFAMHGKLEISDGSDSVCCLARELPRASAEAVEEHRVKEVR